MFLTSFLKSICMLDQLIHEISLPDFLYFHLNRLFI